MPVHSSRLTHGDLTADWQERFNVERMREYRVERARQTMRKHGVAALLEASPNYIRYLTGLVGYNHPMVRYTLFFADHDPIMFEHDGWYHQMPDQAPWIKEWRPAQAWLVAAPGVEASRYQAKSFAAEIKSELEAKGLLGEKIGINGFDGFANEALREAGVTNLTSSHSLMLEARAVKSADEIKCMKHVAAIVEGMWFKVWETLRPGVTDTELGAIASYTGLMAGADNPVVGGWRSGPLGFDRGFSNTGRIIQTGDLVYGSLCGVTYQGYRTCTYRSFKVAAEPTQKEKDWYKELRDRIDAIIDAIKPGNTTADAAKHFPPATKWGYADEMEVLASEVGHGIGLASGGSYDYPIINRAWSLDFPQEFEEGMCLAVESREGEQRVGGVRLENMLVITKDGAEIIDHFPREEILVAPL